MWNLFQRSGSGENKQENYSVNPKWAVGASGLRKLHRWINVQWKIPLQFDGCLLVWCLQHGSASEGKVLPSGIKSQSLRSIRSFLLYRWILWLAVEAVKRFILWIPVWFWRICEMPIRPNLSLIFLIISISCLKGKHSVVFLLSSLQTMEASFRIQKRWSSLLEI